MYQWERTYRIMSLSGSKPFSDLAIKMKKIPVKVALDSNRTIPEAVNLVKFKLIVFDMPSNSSFVRGTDIDS